MLFLDVFFVKEYGISAFFTGFAETNVISKTFATTKKIPLFYNLSHTSSLRFIIFSKYCFRPLLTSPSFFPTTFLINSLNNTTHTRFLLSYLGHFPPKQFRNLSIIFS